MADRLRAGFTFYDDHTSAWDIEIFDYDFPTPKLKEIKDTVAYRDGAYDFSFLYGEPAYEERTITFDGRIYCNDFQERGVIITDLKKWLLNKPASILTTEIYPNLEYFMKCIELDYSIKSYCIEFKVTFVGEPKATNIITLEKVL
ncbi:hypothetical protein [Macrococcus animalis]|uniref:hypothetical protein n=1 Tax=Macrococcus animalis TaxID=3395467 RepID=UPI0039BE4142